MSHTGHRSRPVPAWLHFTPFALAALLALLAVDPRPGASVAGFRVAVACAGLLLLAGGVTAWAHRGRGWRLLPPLAYFAVVGVLRVAESDLNSGSTALALLPVLWLALHGSRRQLLAALGLSTVVLVGPVAALPGHYGPGELLRAGAWTVITGLVGLTVYRLVSQTRRAAAEASRRAAVLLERETTLRSVGELARRMFVSGNVRQAVCEAAQRVARADRVYLLEPEDGVLVTKATSAPTVPPVCVELDTGPSAASIAFTSGQAFVVPDAVEHPAAPSRPVTAGGERSLVFQPILRDASTVGVLVVGWLTHRDVVSDHVLAALDLLAAEAALAVERADLLAELAVQARSDPLTGLGNRRTWNERLDHELARARRTREPLSVALLDLDRFKLFNDRYGHQAGDRLLKEAAAAWRHALRDTDTLVRWGGEEFALLLPRCTAEEARTLLERLRARTPGDQTCSAGIAQWQRDEAPDALVHRADVALYEAKRLGRDRAVIAAADRRGAGEPAGESLDRHPSGAPSTVEVDLDARSLPASGTA